MATQRVALVTGASRNIGRAIALALARSGYAVACFSRDAAALEETAALAREAGGPSSVFVGDAKSNRSMEEFARHAIAVHGGIDVVVNNAGVLRQGRPEDVTAEAFAEDIQVDLVSPFALARAAYASMKSRGGGAVVNIGSMAGAMALPASVAYCAAKAGIDGLTRALAYDWARDNIRVVCVAPGYVRSDITKGVLSNPRAFDQILQRIPMRRVAEPEEIADFVAFMASDRARFCTGETYYVDGGQRMAL